MPQYLGFCAIHVAKACHNSQLCMHVFTPTDFSPLISGNPKMVVSHLPVLLPVNIPTSWLYPQNYQWQNGKRYKGKPKRVQSALARRMCHCCTGPPPPPSLQSCIGLLRNFVFVISRNFHEIFNLCSAKIKIILSKFCVLQNFDKIIFNFAEIGGKFCKTQNYENEKFRSNPTPTQSAVCYSPSPSVC